MRVLACALAALSLVGCGAAPVVQADPAANPGVIVVWERVADVQAVCEGQSHRKEFFKILGCARWKDSTTPGGPRVCTIYAPEPRIETDMQRFATLGHELMHCFDGNWHDAYGGMKPKSTAVSRNP